MDFVNTNTEVITAIDIYLWLKLPSWEHRHVYMYICLWLRSEVKIWPQTVNGCDRTCRKATVARWRNAYTAGPPLPNRRGIAIPSLNRWVVYLWFHYLLCPIWCSNFGRALTQLSNVISGDQRGCLKSRWLIITM